MTFTRAQVEVTLVSRCKKRMEFVGMAVTQSGSNADLNDPIATALMQTGITPANVVSIADGDLAAVTDFLKLCDLAELRLLENILGNADKVTLQAASGSESFSDFVTATENLIERKEQAIQRKHGIGLGATTTGKRSLNFQAESE